MLRGLCRYARNGEFSSAEHWRLNLDHQFETIDLTQLEHVAGGGKIARALKDMFKKIFADASVTATVNTSTGEPNISIQL
jgi:hypothetical protein